MSIMLRLQSAALAAAGLILLCLPANAQEEVVQTLETVVVHSVNTVLEMEFVAEKVTPTDIIGASFTTCESTAINGIYCLDGNLVRNWPDPEDELQVDTVVDCTDPALGLDGKPGACSGMTVDSTGGVWISGRKKGNSYSLFKIVRKPVNSGCTADPGLLTLTQDYCAAEVVTGRKALVSLSSIDGTVGASFEHGKGILALEDKDQAVFFPQNDPQNDSPFVIASGKQDWGLVGNESIQSVAVLPFPVGSVDNFVVAATDAGRVLAADAEGSASAFQVYNIPAGAEQCDSNASLYGIRASSQSGLAYVTDRQFCEVIALQPVQSGSTFELNKLAALSTATESGPNAPVGPSVAPGTNVDLDDCDPGPCTLIQGEDGVGATLANVSLVDNSNSDMTLFQIKNIPDCRYIPQECHDLLGLPGGADPVADLIQAGVIVNLDSSSMDNPAAQLLNVTLLLPLEITDLFADSGELPPMLISRQYRGQNQNDYRFEGLFGVPEDGVVFNDTFDGEFFVDVLTGSDDVLDCQQTWPAATPIESILAWDIVTTVSERVRTISDPHIGAALDAGNPDQEQFVDTLTNVGCGSSKTAGTRWSLKPYNLEVTPCTFNPNYPDVWQGDCDDDGIGTADDAVMAKLLLQLYDDLGEALNQLACDNVDGQSQPPLSAPSCSGLNDQWANGKDKLDKCWSATQQPKQSAGAQNCQSFATQLDGFRTMLAGVTPQEDPENRVSELKARAATIFHVYQDRFLPSVPSGGYSEP